MEITSFDDGLKLLAAAALGAVFFGTVSQGDSNQQPIEKVSASKTHTLTVTDPWVASGCSALEAAYWAAVAAVEDAEDQADLAYTAWYDCDQGGGQYTPPSLASIKADSVSILD